MRTRCNHYYSTVFIQETYQFISFFVANNFINPFSKYLLNNIWCMPGPVLGAEKIMMRKPPKSKNISLDLSGKSRLLRKILHLSLYYEKETGYCMLLKDIKLHPQESDPVTI